MVEVGHSEKKKKCFVISPIGESGTDVRIAADRVLKHIIRKALDGDFEILRADENSNPGAISPRIVGSILEADLVVVDMSGSNPNVFYELAIAHGFRRPTVHIQRTGEKPAFDVKDMNTVRYDITDPDDVEMAQKRLREYARHAVEQPDSVETPLSSAERFVRVESSADPVAESNVQVMRAIRSLTTEVRRSVNHRGASVSSSASNEDHLTGLRSIVKRVVLSGRADATDFESVITQNTSQRYDDWMRRQLRLATGIDEDVKLNEVLFDDNVANGAAEMFYDIDEGYKEDADSDDM